jgi:hypothetical protein
MGVYSWVEHTCDCGGEVQFQTKCGPQEYGSYPINAVPIEVFEDIRGQRSECFNCGKSYTILPARKDYSTVSMMVEEG